MTAAVISWSRSAGARGGSYCAVVQRKMDCYLTACDSALPLTLVDATSASAKLCDDCVFALSIDRTDAELDDLLAAVGARLSIDARLELLGRDEPRQSASLDLRLKQALIATDGGVGLPYDAMTAEVGGYVGEDVEA